MTTEGLKREFLDPSGWTRSQRERAPLRVDGRPVPWFTYGAIEFLQRVVRSADRVFEYGAGYSTLWWQDRVAKVCSVEHDSEWCERLRPSLKANAALFEIGADCAMEFEAMVEFVPFFERTRRTEWSYDADRIVRRGLSDERFIAYARKIAEVDGPFDFIVIDGMARRLCTFVAVKYLKPDGFVIFDNSNRGDYDLAYTLLDENGFRHIPFWGLVPGANFLTCTSFFTRCIDRLPGCAFVGNSFGLPEY